MWESWTGKVQLFVLDAEPRKTDNRLYIVHVMSSISEIFLLFKVELEVHILLITIRWKEKEIYRFWSRLGTVGVLKFSEGSCNVFKKIIISLLSNRFEIYATTDVLLTFWFTIFISKITWVSSNVRVRFKGDVLTLIKFGTLLFYACFISEEFIQFVWNIWEFLRKIWTHINKVYSCFTS